MTAIAVDKDLIAYCGLYCGACGSYLKGRCKGCRKNEKASWCKVRQCGIAHAYGSCADCAEFSDPVQCRKINNMVSKMFALIFRSNRFACIAAIRKLGAEGYAADMAAKGMMTIRK